jgi:uncharacterized iron-regulated membrane protein
MATSTHRAAPEQAPPSSAFYRAVWRWHFYAGLFCLPFLLLLALSGGVYLFKDELDRLVYADRMLVEPRPEAPPVAPSLLVTQALAAHPGAQATRYIAPAAPDRAAEIGITTADGAALSVYLDPHDGRVLGSLDDGLKAMEIVRQLHSLELLGSYGNRVIEIVGGWALILVATGIYLWWPRRQAGGVVSLRGTPARRIFWRDLHAVTGAFAGVLVFFLALSGMPWSGVFGDWLNRSATALGQGYPVYVWDAVPISTVPLSTTGEAGWTVAGSPLPVSAEMPGVAAIGIDRAAAIVEGLGITPGYKLSLPAEPTGVYTATIFPDDLALQRIIHLDQYSGAALVDVGMVDYGGIAQVVEWGISLHMGQAFGLLNQLVMLATCLAIIVMAVAAIVMWWKRRPQGRLGVPPLPAARSAPWLLGAIILPFALLLPLVGLSLAAALLLDWLVIQRIPALRAAVS